METVTADEAQDKLAILIKNAACGEASYRITSSEGAAVLLSEESYQNLMITLEMLSTPLFLDKDQ